MKLRSISPIFTRFRVCSSFFVTKHSINNPPLHLSGNSLSVARAFGDFHFKPNEGGAPNPVSVRPVVRRFPLNSVFGVILVCDGVTEAVTSLDVVKIAAKEFLKVDDVMDSRGLAIRAYKQGSGDNISVGLIRMGK